jgi:transposase-like protein
MTALTDPHFQNDAAARALIESIRWPDGQVCSHCGTIGHAYAVTGRAGLYRCAEPECRKDFTCTTGTVMERSKIPLHKWMIGFYLMNASKKGISAHQLHRTLGLTYQTAWFMCHRIREAMRDGGLSGPLGGGGKIVETDETYFGNVPEAKRPTRNTKGGKFTKGGRSGPSGKRAIVALVERRGRVRSFHPAVADGASVGAIVRDNIAREAHLMTDESRLYIQVGQELASHETVTHSHKEYVRSEKRMLDDETFIIHKVHTNTIEGYFSIFKRGMKGVYQHCKEKHLHRYLAEFDHRYNHRVALGFNDTDRMNAAIKGVEGKRLTYRQPH